MRFDLCLNLPSDVSTIAVARHIASCSLREMGADPRDVGDVELALSEACANVIEHAGVDQEYEVHLGLDDRTCQIRVIDAGASLDLRDTDHEMPTLDADHGRGIALMRAIVDRLDFVSAPETGTVVRLVKQLDVGPGEPDGQLSAPTTG